MRKAYQVNVIRTESEFWEDEPSNEYIIEGFVEGEFFTTLDQVRGYIEANAAKDWDNERDWPTTKLKYEVYEDHGYTEVSSDPILKEQDLRLVEEFNFHVRPELIKQI